MFGTQEMELVGTSSELVDSGLESGRTYAKSLRMAKSYIGTT